jgi:hypothetical protein
LLRAVPADHPSPLDPVGTARNTIEIGGYCCLSSAGPLGYETEQDGTVSKRRAQLPPVLVDQMIRRWPLAATALSPTSPCIARGGGGASRARLRVSARHPAAARPIGDPRRHADRRHRRPARGDGRKVRSWLEDELVGDERLGRSHLTVAWLIAAYVRDGRSTLSIAQEAGVTGQRLRQWLAECAIPLRGA